ncbi:DUF1360 domain-containing protein [Streptomyces poonensis]|uniref:Membrane protein n=1 Tax=Streptomyces poonensis TaxID=68255 RepID=A0A918PDF5_9ACTN|nr:DUF1360 domain-containing protein [Streptomyces poonensis]GGY99875.1 membrane protein [Streptomyces poonensis]GLJ92183.1 membrane protein [Streptomyces poonensis]
MTASDRPYDDQDEVPLKGYAVLAATFATGVTLFAVTARRRGVRLPERVPPWDLALLGTATFKASRLLTKDKITSFLRAPFTRRETDGTAGEVQDQPRGVGLRRAVGDLVACPFCTSAWVAGTLVGGYAVAPRAARLVCAGLSAVTMADFLQYAWTWTEQTENHEDEE